MTRFDALPPIPASYSLLSHLTKSEITEARHFGYVVDKSDPSLKQAWPSHDEIDVATNPDDIREWRTRLYAVWFCYVYENFASIQRPLYAIEELFLHFKTNILNDNVWPGLAQLYAGAGASDPISSADRERHLAKLRRYYSVARRLLGEPTEEV